MNPKLQTIIICTCSESRSSDAVGRGNLRWPGDWARNFNFRSFIWIDCSGNPDGCPHLSKAGDPSSIAWPRKTDGSSMGISSRRWMFAFVEPSSSCGWISHGQSACIERSDVLQSPGAARTGPTWRMGVLKSSTGSSWNGFGIFRGIRGRESWKPSTGALRHSELCC